MKTLTIDIGNSRVKVDAWGDKGFLSRVFEGSLADAMEKDGLNKVFSETDRPIEGIIVSSVRKDTEEFIDWLKELSGVEVIDFNADEVGEYYDLFDYHFPIGADRVAAYLGAQVNFGDLSKLIIDFGTAITIDIAGADGRFYGGNISLGLFSRMKALAQQTDLLPNVNEISEKNAFGLDTASAIGAGALNGVLGEVKYSIELAKKIHDIKVVIFTGGDARRIYFALDKDNDLLMIEDPFLVGRGLDHHLRSHYLNVKAPHLHIRR